MRLTNDCCTNLFSESVETLDSLHRSAIADLFSDPRLQLVQLNEQEYAESQIAYRSHDNEKEVILEATLEATKKRCLHKKATVSLVLVVGLDFLSNPL